MQNTASAARVQPQSSAPTGESLLPANADFASKFQRSDFMFDHGLAEHPLFELPALIELAKRTPKSDGFAYWQNGRIPVNAKWDDNPAQRLSLEDTVAGIAKNDSLVIIKHAEQDPIYGSVLQEILQRIYSFVSPSAQADIVLGESLIFLNSPGRKTAYHLDLESNFLLQVSGVKLVRVFDCKDRTITPHTELEGHCAGNHNSATYKPERDADAHFYRLTKGHGLHFPSLGPHWVQNGDEVSISININFDTISIHQRLKRIYRVNRLLRRAGIDPTPPGVSRLRDALKDSAAATTSAVKKVFGAGPAAPDSVHGVWRPTRISR